MHQRHTSANATALTACEGGDCCGGAPPAPSRPRRVRKKRPTDSSLWEILDDDIVILLIQFVSVCILLGCGVILWNGKTTNVHVNVNMNMDMNMNMNMNGNPEKELDHFEKEQGGPHSGSHSYPKVPLPASRIYTIPGSMNHIGDKSDEYARLRKEFDSIELPEVPPKRLYKSHPLQGGTGPTTYDIHNCPEHPPEGYPYAWYLMDIITHWPPDDPTPRPEIFQGLCVFDYTKDYDKALNYRNAEVPFVVINDPKVQDAVRRWNAPNYMPRMLGDTLHRAEYSTNNHFMYWNKPPKNQKKRKQSNPNKPWQRFVETPANWSQPTEMIRMTYKDWVEHANVTDQTLLSPDHSHWYFRLIGCGETGPLGECDKGASEYLFDELTFFQPKHGGLYLTDPTQQKGIHCRFGMKGVIAENHFDGSRNAIVVLGGERRYILSHPDQCDHLCLYPKGHPSARHSAIDWSQPDLQQFPEFQLAQGNEVVMQAGHVLYLPTDWFHYIISLELNFQCNTRSGVSNEYQPSIHQCGF